MGSVTGIAPTALSMVAQSGRRRTGADPLGRERQHLAGQRYGDHGHADARRAVAQRLVPEVVQNVVAEVIGKAQPRTVGMAEASLGGSQ